MELVVIVVESAIAFSGAEVACIPSKLTTWLRQSPLTAGKHFDLKVKTVEAYSLHLRTQLL